MIEVAVVLSALVQHWADFAVILTLLIVNSIVGFWEEYQAGNAIATLKSKLALRARVRRGGRWTVIPARELVPGDVLRLRLGDVVPADAKLLDGDPAGDAHRDRDQPPSRRSPVPRSRALWPVAPASSRGRRCRDRAGGRPHDAAAGSSHDRHRL